MTYASAKQKILLKWLFGLPIAVIASVSSVVSVLKFLYFGLDKTGQAPNFLALPIKRLVYSIYENTNKFGLDFFWTYSPIPGTKILFSEENFKFILIYLLIFMGMWLINSAKSLTARIAAIDLAAENERLRISATGKTAPKKPKTNQNLLPQGSEEPSKWHVLYIAPILSAIFAAIITKLAGLT
jgi:YniB-like protein